MAIFQDSDFVGKEFVPKVDAPAYFSTMAKRYYFVASKDTDVGKIRAIVTDKKTGKKFFNVTSPNYAGKQLYFKYETANFSDLVGQGVRTTKEKAADDRKFFEDQQATFLDKLKPLLLAGAGIYAVIQLGKEQIKTSNGR